MISSNILINTFLVAFVLNLFLIWLSHRTDFLLKKTDLVGIQKFHTHPAPRIAGISIFVGFFLGVWLEFGFNRFFYVLLISSIPVFLGGLIEDFYARVSPMIRMCGAFLSASFVFFWLNIKIDDLGFENLDYLLSDYIWISFIFTLLAISLVINSFNIIDGFNGLMIGYSLIVSLSLAYIAYQLGDNFVFNLSLILTFSMLGFFILNFPFGKIFAGDGGAYFVGFMIAVIGLMLGIRNEEVTHWFILLLLIYPIFEVVFSIYRRKIALGASPTDPDGDHLHHQIYRILLGSKISSNKGNFLNTATSPFLWLVSLIGVCPALIWYDNRTMLIISAVIFMIIYTIIYQYISKNKFKFT